MSNSRKPTFEEIKFGHFLIKIGHYPKEVKYAVFGAKDNMGDKDQ